MSFNALALYDNIVPLTQPIDGGTTDFVTPYVNLKGAHKVAFLVQFGVTTEAATTDVIDVTVQGATAEGGTEGEVAYNYRLSSAVTANTWGAVTAATTAGIDLTKNHEGMSLWIEPDMGVAGNRGLRIRPAGGGTERVHGLPGRARSQSWTRATA